MLIVGCFAIVLATVALICAVLALVGSFHVEDVARRVERLERDREPWT